MISVSTTYNNIISNGGQYEWQIVNGANTYDKTNIMNGTITQTQFQEFSVGNVVAAELNLNLWNTPSVDTSSPLSVQFRATNGSSNSAWYTKGIFFIDTVETSPYSEVTHITAFDAMLKAEVVYMKEGTWASPTTYQVLTQIATDLGVSIESATDTFISGNPITMSAVPDLGESGTTDREMLSFIGAMYGGNFIIDSTGELKLLRLYVSPSNTAAVGDAVSTFDASPVESISKVRVWLDSENFFAFPELPLQTHTPEDITDHSNDPICIRAYQFMDEWDALSGSLLDVDLPFYATYDIAKNIYNNFVGKTFTPYTANRTFVDPKYELGDGITIKDVTSIIANQELNINAIADSDLRIQGEEILNSYYPYISPIKKEVARNEAKTQASLSVLDDRITSEVQTRTESDDELRSSISQTAESITTEITAQVTSASNDLAQNITDAKNELQGEIDSTNSALGGLSTRTSTLEQTATSFQATLSTKITQADADAAASSAVGDFQDELSTYIRYYQSGGTGVLELGDSNSGYVAKLNNQRLGFYDGDTEVAYISNNKLFITNAEITGNLQIGHYQWLTDSTGRMSLKWVN